MKLVQRPRRLRRSAYLRNAVAETELRAASLVLPVFLTEESGKVEEIASMPGTCRYSLDTVSRVLREAADLGIGGIALFPKIAEKRKNAQASEALNPDGLVPNAVRAIKREFPSLTIFTDIALDPFSSDGHDGLVREGKVLNDETVEILARMAVLHAEAGADFVAPSDMMDGRVGAIRAALDGEGFADTGILSYSAKYASCFYGPFRDALDSAPRAGDKKTYQMDPRNVHEALREARLDLEEGADLLMVKPAGAYLDVIRAVKELSDVPVAAYQVSGEYSMIRFGGERGLFDWRQAMEESLLAIRRAGADLIFTYFALEMAGRLRAGR